MSFNTKFRTMSSVAVLLAFGLAAGNKAQAGEATYLPNDASHCEIFRVLSHDVPGECLQASAASAGLRTRSIKFHAPQQAAVAHSVAATAPLVTDDQDVAVEVPATGSEPLSLAMRIQFEHNSSVLTEQAKASLDGIAAVLNNDIMADKIVMLEGHADATGSDDYNLSLSVRRARAVQTYLVSEHEIENWRLPFTGKGETELFDRSAPTSPINRRVEFTNITG